MRLIVIRHGETEHNRGQITLGRADVPLNARGRLQARAVAASFMRPPNAIYTSPLSRAAETAGAIARGTGVAVSVDERLIEMDVGEMEHLTSAELRERYPDFLREWFSDGAGARMPGGETLREVQERAWTWVEEAVAAHPRETVVAVTHNFVIASLLCRALNLPLGEFRRLRNVVASRSVIDISDTSSCQVLQLNDVSHLLAGGLADDLSGREAPR